MRSCGWLALLLICSMGVLSGCDNSPVSGRVRGVVTFDGKPLPVAGVYFYPTSDLSPSTGLTNDKGEYELAFTYSAKGAVPGTHRVVVSTAVQVGEMTSPAKELLPKAYTQLSTTPLTKEVKPGKNTINIEVTSQ